MTSVAPTVADLLAGQVQVVFDALPNSIGHIRAGKLRSLAVTTATRPDALPDVPTMSDFVPGFETSAWNGVGVPRNTPAAIIDRLNNEINAALADPKLKARFSDFGAASTRLPNGILHGEGDSILNVAARIEGPHKGQHPIRSRVTDLLKLTRENTPFMSLWATNWATDALIWHRLQEWINPGYLARSERRQRDQQGTQFLVSPSKTDQWITGKRALPQLSDLFGVGGYSVIAAAG